MAIEWSQSIEDVDWQELADLIRAAPLGDKTPNFLRTVFTNSLYREFAREDGRLVAAGRALSDGADVAYLADIVVHPDMQGQGLGGTLIRRLMGRLRGHRKVILYAVPGREPLYRKYGFLRMTTAMAVFEDPEVKIEQGYLSA